MNTDKTKLIWIECKRMYKEKLQVSVKLDWYTTKFDLLDITFSMDLNKIPSLNYDIIKARKVIKNWNSQYLTPLTQHLFTQCNPVQELWSNIVKWIQEKVTQNYVICEINKLFGYLLQDQNFWPMNFILKLTRQYMFLVCQKKTSSQSWNI